MGEKDIVEKVLIDYNDVFADIVNALLFDGENVISENELQNTKDKSQYKFDGKIHEHERDLSKIWQKCNVNIAFMGIENQTNVDAFMPLRIIGYDGAIYRSQYQAEKTVAYPVISIVLNFSKKQWKSNKRLSDIMTIPEQLKTYFQDYEINVFDIAYLSEQQVLNFKSDFMIIADYFVKTLRNPTCREFVKKDIEHVDEVLKLMKILTNDSRYETIANSRKLNHILEKGGAINMCTVLDAVEQQGIEKGIEKGGFQMLVKLFSDGTLTIHEAARAANMDEASFTRRMNADNGKRGESEHGTN